MRYRPEHKDEVRQKLLKDASQRVRAEGLSGAAVSSVMRDAGLTHGGFYKHFASKDELIAQSVVEAFREMSDRLVRAGEHSPPGMGWKAIVKAYLSLEHCEHPQCGCPLAALGPELARANRKMQSRLLGELQRYKSRMVPFMPGRRTADKEQAFFAIFSTMAGAIELARMLPKPLMRKKVLASARDFLLRSF